MQTVYHDSCAYGNCLCKHRHAWGCFLGQHSDWQTDMGIINLMCLILKGSIFLNWLNILNVCDVWVLGLGWHMVVEQPSSDKVKIRRNVNYVLHHLVSTRTRELAIFSIAKFMQPTPVCLPSYCKGFFSTPTVYACVAHDAFDVSKCILGDFILWFMTLLQIQHRFFSFV